MRILWSYGSGARDDRRGTGSSVFRQAAPPYSRRRDDSLWDGRRLDSREAVMEWLAEVEAKRAEEASASARWPT